MVLAVVLALMAVLLEQAALELLDRETPEEMAELAVKLKVVVEARVRLGLMQIQRLIDPAMVVPAFR
ncbi:MAG: hypothetical protein EBR82_67240 [Caulobacteraceae bacterium]|nr:hypothetical protein [Caulobacteraceae bacterium]